MVDNFYISDMVVRDGEQELTFVARVLTENFEWPRMMYFDNKTWYFSEVAPLDFNDIENFNNKAIYRLTQPEVIPDVVPNVPKYYIVGATFGDGTVDMLPEFLRRGVWRNGYERTKGTYNAVFDTITPGDRIAVKRLRGQGQSEMTVLAVGIVKEVDENGSTLYVKWLVQFKDRVVPLKGCIGTLSGPYTPGAWINSIFSI